MGEVVSTWAPDVEAVSSLANDIIDDPSQFRRDLPPAIAVTEAAAKRLVRPAGDCVEALQELYAATSSGGSTEDAERARQALNVATRTKTISQRLAETAKEWFERVEAGEGLLGLTGGWARDVRDLNRVFDDWAKLTAADRRVRT